MYLKMDKSKKKQPYEKIILALKGCFFFHFQVKMFIWPVLLLQDLGFAQ